VFVSSTLRELAEERKAVRAAVERMRLAPVMFELGARPHPPRDLYRAYLQRSEIFLGLYWQRYGWIAPDETVSGLEDEYNLAPPMMPRLIYIKDTGEAPEPRLGALLERIMIDDRASFKTFETVAELRELVEADLATLLADRFDAAGAGLAPLGDMPPDGGTAGIGHHAGGQEAASTPVPTPLTALIGRGKELDAITALLTQDGVRLVTLTGSGGIGKSRLAIEVGRSMRGVFPDGVTFVSLAAVTDPALVPAAIAGALGVRDTGAELLVDTLVTALQNRTSLIIADNFEQVLGAAPTLTALLSAVPGLSFLVTSRTVLRVLGEHTIKIGPLHLPVDTRLSPAAALESPSVQLFVERARSVKPDVEVTDENVAAITGVCRHLEGVPLALELAAASIRLLPPAALLDRLRRHRPLAAAARDLPTRQRTIEDTIEWSVRLLSDQEAALLSRLGVFSGGFSLDAAEAIAGDGIDVLENLGSLVDSSLIHQQDRGDRAHFTMLVSVQEFARRGLAESGLLEVMRETHARYYIDRGDVLEGRLKGPHQGETVLALLDEQDNLRAAVEYLIECREWDRLATLAWRFYVYWWVGGLLGEIRGWMDDLLDADDIVTDRSRAIALYFTRAVTFWQEPHEWVVPGLTESAELFHASQDLSGEALARTSIALAHLAGSTPDVDRADDELETALTLFRSVDDVWGETLALVTLGRVAMLDHKVQRALNRFDESFTLAHRQEDTLSEAIAVHHLGWAFVMLGDVSRAASHFKRSLTASSLTAHAEGIAYGLEGLVAVAATTGATDTAGLLLGAAEALRERTGLYNAPTFSFHQQMIAPILESEAAAAFTHARGEGRGLTASAAVAIALDLGNHGIDVAAPAEVAPSATGSTKARSAPPLPGMPG
jgi:predicted ATPase